LVHIVPGNESFGKIKISTECGSAGWSVVCLHGDRQDSTEAKGWVLLEYTVICVQRSWPQLCKLMMLHPRRRPTHVTFGPEWLLMILICTWQMTSQRYWAAEYISMELHWRELLILSREVRAASRKLW
jgi:hypothetical protein